MPTERELRRRRILELCASHDLRTQEDVAAALLASGQEATQSSVSRDIAALGLVKIDGVYRRPQRTARPKVNPDVERITDVVLSVETAGDALIVLKTPAGEANHVAVGIDRLAWREIVGTIAGDDTIFVAVRDRSARARMLERLKKLQG